MINIGTLSVEKITQKHSVPHSTLKLFKRNRNLYFLASLKPSRELERSTVVFPTIEDRGRVFDLPVIVKHTRNVNNFIHSLRNTYVIDSGGNRKWPVERLLPAFLVEGHYKQLVMKFFEAFSSAIPFSML